MGPERPSFRGLVRDVIDIIILVVHLYEVSLPEGVHDVLRLGRREERLRTSAEFGE